MKEICSTVAGEMPSIDYQNELALWELVIEANKKGLLCCAKDLSSGGAAVALGKMAATSGLGCGVTMTVSHPRDIFSESMARAIIEVAPENAAAFEAMLGTLACEKIGTVGGDSVKINDVTLPLAALDDLYYNTFKKVIEQDI